MKLLVAEDDVLFQKLLVQVLAADHEIVLASNGDEAWELLQRPDAPRLAILDWVMPGLTGPEICRLVRACERLRSMYLIILTSKNNEADVVSGLRAGADDYIGKPPNAAELRGRVLAGERVLALQATIEAQSSATRKKLAGDAVERKSSPRPRGKKTARLASEPTAVPGLVSQSFPEPRTPEKDAVLHSLENVDAKR